MNLNDGPDLKDIPMGYLEKIVGAIPDLENKDMWWICQHIFRATYMKYSLKFWEEKARAEKFQETIIEKNGEIDKLIKEISDLKEQLGYACEKNGELQESINSNAESSEN